MANGEATVTPIITPVGSDKAIYAVVLAIVTVFAGAIARKWGVEINVAETATLATSIISYIIMHKWKSGMLQKAEMAGTAASAEIVELKQAIEELRKKVA